MVKIPESTSRALTNTTPRVRVATADSIPDAEERRKLAPPPTRGFTSIPTPDVLEKLIAQAVSALRRGIFWDRGSILNIVV